MSQQKIRMMAKILLLNRERLYLFVAVDFLLALCAVTYWPMSQININPISMFSVFMMLYPMVTGMAVEKVKKSGTKL